MLLAVVLAAALAPAQVVVVGRPYEQVGATTLVGPHHWAEQPSVAELQTLMTPGAPNGFVNIYNCRVLADGRLSDCVIDGPGHLTSVVREALPHFRLPAEDVARLGKDGWVNTSVQWGEPPPACIPPTCIGVVPPPPPSR